MRRTRGRLADGREIIYYDAGDGPARDAVDARALPPRSGAGELRRDPLSGDWIIVAAHRQGRTHLPAAEDCPLCPSTAERATEIPGLDYDVVVFENRFASLSGAGAEPQAADDGANRAGRFARRPGAGRCEIVCFSPDHDAAFADLPPERVRTVLDVWADRTRELSRLPGIQQIFPFENRGREIGVTLTHPHGQIYAYPYLPPRTRRTLELARAQPGLFSGIVAAETTGERVVAASAHWIAFVPRAARWPLEVHIYPRRAVPDLPALDDAEREDFCALYLDLLRRVDALYRAPLPYVAAWHQAPVHEGRELWRLRLELLSIRRSPSKLKYLAGSEAAMGAFINDVAPEQAAATLRELAAAPMA
jgi:UDPglucose--hexose-1-phosphate uridylyltransferase